MIKSIISSSRLMLILVALASQFVNLVSKFTYCVAAPLNLAQPPKFHFAPVAPLNFPWPPKGPFGTAGLNDKGEGHFGAADSVPCRFGAGHFSAISYFILFFELRRKNNEAGNFLNAVERVPAETRVLNPTASEASYKPKPRSYKKLI